MPRHPFRHLASGAALSLLAACTAGRSSLAFDDSSERIERSMAFELFSAATPGAQGIALASDATPLASPGASSPTPTELRQTDWTTVGAGWPRLVAPRGVAVARPDLCRAGPWPSTHRR